MPLSIFGSEFFTRISRNAGVPQASILNSVLFLLSFNELPDDVICNIAIYADGTLLYTNVDQVPSMWQQLQLA